MIASARRAVPRPPLHRLGCSRPRRTELDVRHHRAVRSASRRRGMSRDCSPAFSGCVIRARASITNFYSRLWEAPLERRCTARAGAARAQAELADRRRRDQPAPSQRLSRDQKLAGSSLSACRSRCWRLSAIGSWCALWGIRHLALANFHRGPAHSASAPSATPRRGCRSSCRRETRPATFRRSSRARLRWAAGRN